ncbi:hypothetical protein BIY40_05740 [Pediococcus acidilactici]|nr:hypothetical protein BIY40_05740 [Pediococcus acidilactici]
MLRYPVSPVNQISGPIAQTAISPDIQLILVLNCHIAKTNSGQQFFPVNQILGSIAQTAIKPKIQLILKNYPLASIL